MSAKAIGIEASRLMNNPKVALALTRGYEAIDQQTAHTGASLRLFLARPVCPFNRRWAHLLAPPVV